MLRESDQTELVLTPQQCLFLLVLARRPDEVLAYDAIKRALWPDFKELDTLNPRLREVKSSLCRLLEDNGQLIQTVTGQGYQLNGPVTQAEALDESRKPSRTTPPASLAAAGTTNSERVITRGEWDLPGTVSDVLGPLLLAPLLYALLFVVALFLEIAYQFESLGLWRPSWHSLFLSGNSALPWARS